MPTLEFGAQGVLGFRALLGYQLCCKEDRLGFRARGFPSFWFRIVLRIPGTIPHLAFGGYELGDNYTPVLW